MNGKLRELLKSNKIPKEYEPRYVLSWIGGDDIEIDYQTRDRILEAMNRGVKHIELFDELVVMVSSIRSIFPKYGVPNIPPRPELSTWEASGGDSKAKREAIRKWDEIFGNLRLDSENTEVKMLE